MRTLPGSSAKGSDPSLQHAPEEDSRVLASDNEVQDTESGEEVNQQTRDDGHHVPPQLLGSHRQVW